MSGADVVYKDVVEPLESVSVSITPTEKKDVTEFGDIADVSRVAWGWAEAAAAGSTRRHLQAASVLLQCCVFDRVVTCIHRLQCAAASCRQAAVNAASGGEIWVALLCSCACCAYTGGQHSRQGGVDSSRQ